MIDTHNAQPVVECIGLTKVFSDFWGRGKVRAVDDLNLEIRPGEVFGLLGPNGSGKSTTIKMLLGLLFPTAGAARIFGRPPTDTAIKTRIGFMPEESYLYRYLNAHETLSYYGRLFNLDRHEQKRRTEQLIEMVGLKRAARRPVGTYSKGMARRIGLAQALINDPDLLILDEPTTGLDPVGTRQIKDVIRAMADHGKTVLLCSHLLADVEDVCDRVAIMYGGRLRAKGDVEELLERQDITQINAESLDEKTLAEIRAVIENAGRRLVSVEHPTDRLEALFLRVVGQAQRERLETSGAESTVGVAQFLAKEAGAGEVGLLDRLVEAGRSTVQAPGEQKRPAPAPTAPEPKRDVLEKLTQVEEQSAAEEKHPADAPRPMKETRPREDVLKQLLGKNDDADKSS